MTKSDFSTHFKIHQTAFKRFALKLAKCHGLANDLVQEAAYKAFRSIHTFKSGSSFKSWFFTIIKNLFISHYRKRRRRATIHTPVEDLMYAMDRKKTVRNEGIGNLKLEEIHDCMNGLTEKSKYPFQLFIRGYQYNEISEQLNIPIGTVKSRINYARTQLKDRLTSREYRFAA